MNDKPENPISVQQVEYSYRTGGDVLRGVSLDGKAGELLCLLGPNGSGKTTLLKTLLGQLKPSAGQVILDGKNIFDHSTRERAKLVAYVPQNPASAFAFNVQQIVMMGRLAHNGPLGAGSKQDYDIAHAAMDMTHTRKFASRTLAQLSGGEAQCVMIARAIAQQPQVLLLDEPTSQLDLKNQLLIYRMMQRLAHDWGMSLICVCHDINLASRFSDRIVLMKQGKILAAGTPQEVINKDILCETYDVETELIHAPGYPTPIVVGH